ncbi:hypothetical protein [Streptomyces cacaoi]|uniref:Uncharacterized protein n=1 Tax=Streptomyces cacaoi TaxID=1898 RepID=A0A4Y3R5J9_STRCI|nr:hypothetical protein [Streptomyces cacaoi]NNG87408.1 hypothetical protein [Streptomyces cacaoi]GEB51210.1 hypothetical protein SCA03_37610 [Streptomyces cacaoi]
MISGIGSGTSGEWARAVDEEARPSTGPADTPYGGGSGSGLARMVVAGIAVAVVAVLSVLLSR